ncbi:hypothetical protein GQ457_15G011040 [Hibiscus cannabinus]
MYGTCNRSRKHLDWELLDKLKGESQLPWLVGGDLNDILCMNERAGGRRKPRVEMDAFGAALERNDLWDIKPSKVWFTWHYGNSVENHVKQRIDRFVASIPWLHKYGQCDVITEFTKDLDHCFLFLNTEGRQKERSHRDYFKFDVCSVNEEECSNIVKSTWCVDGVDTLGKLKNIGVNLNKWQIACRRSAVQCKKQLQNRIESLLDQSITEARLEELKLAKKELKSVLDKEEVYWKQRSRVKWLKEADRNTSFFHARANNRRKKNLIKGIENHLGEWVEKVEDIFQVAQDFFSKLFQSNNGTSVDWILEAVVIVLIPSCPRFLLQTLPSLHASFFRKFWASIGQEFICLCLNLLNGKACMADVNQTIIVLIPKLDNLTLMKHFRLISLCNVVYKTCSKVLVNRVKPLMSHCIAKNQSVFVGGRLISNNVIVANELFHYLKGSKNGSNKGAAIKLDMEKAYDRVEWHFLSDVMAKMGFDPRWIDIVMNFVATVSYCFKINGLSASLIKEQREGRIRGIRASQNGPRVNHLLYADDCLLFIKNSEKEAMRLKQVLTAYESSSGQKINVEKSSIFFSNGTSDQSKAVLNSVLNMREDAVLG